MKAESSFSKEETPADDLGSFGRDGAEEAALMDQMSSLFESLSGDAGSGGEGGGEAQFLEQFMSLAQQLAQDPNLAGEGDEAMKKMMADLQDVKVYSQLIKKPEQFEEFLKAFSEKPEELQETMDSLLTGVASKDMLYEPMKEMRDLVRSRRN